jgi:hypothetical protein
MWVQIPPVRPLGLGLPCRVAVVQVSRASDRSHGLQKLASILPFKGLDTDLMIVKVAVFLVVG